MQLDYSELIPLLRYRWRPDYPPVRRILDRDRSLRLSIDVRLQLKPPTSWSATRSRRASAARRW